VFNKPSPYVFRSPMSFSRQKYRHTKKVSLTPRAPRGSHTHVYHVTSVHGTGRSDGHTSRIDTLASNLFLSHRISPSPVGCSLQHTYESWNPILVLATSSQHAHFCFYLLCKKEEEKVGRRWKRISPVLWFARNGHARKNLYLT
jgi:hypothetical protein